MIKCLRHVHQSGYWKKLQSMRGLYRILSKILQSARYSIIYEESLPKYHRPFFFLALLIGCNHINDGSESIHNNRKMGLDKQ